MSVSAGGSFLDLQLKQLLGALDDEGQRWVVLVGNLAVEDAVLEFGFQHAHLAAGRQAKEVHDFFAVDGRLEVADAVLLLDVLELDANEFEIVEEVALLRFVAAGDVRFAESHEVVNVVARFEEEAAHGAVRHDVVGDGDGAHVEVNQLLDVLHALVQRQFQSAEERRDEFRAQIVVVVEGPSH